MITADNLRDVLTHPDFGFVENGNVFEKHFDTFNCSMKVDFAAKKLILPEQIKGRSRNDSFTQNENFVVFECVHRLLVKGYRPEHIELEKQWTVGHGPSGGRGDICVSGPDGKMLLIIECKTWGKQFDKALLETKADGGQLFSYWQQEIACKRLILYASDFNNGKVRYKVQTIDCTDDANKLLQAKNDNSIKLYRDADTVLKKYAVWQDSYDGCFCRDQVFSEDCVAYQLGKKPIRKNGLVEFDPENRIINQFEEILRHNNVSDKENAFNRLVALFICKLTDEITKGDDDEVEFQYKEGTDNYESLQDRLQRLHKEGMERFMREKIYYISPEYPKKLFADYKGENREKAVEDLQNTIRVLKYYSNNDFAFKEVHNEELFYQNGRILVEMIKLFEDYRIVYPSKNQFLGNLFEDLLNKGFKQNEGQFFTPIPIARFIWDCLPVERMIRADGGTIYPKVIDYACGAGHFLTEAIEAINFFAHSGEDNAWTKDSIFGIEKDYRLARVAKISLFMNGAGAGNIVFGDGLENAPDKGIENGGFDILVANPPYAVKDFKQHLKLKNNSLTLLDRIKLSGNEIETLFIERIGQLLKPKGIAAVILPSSVLSNDSASYVGAREELLKNFYIRGIVAFGPETFYKTNMKTVALFLEKFDEPPKRADLAQDSVHAIFSGDDISDWRDKDIFEAYLAQIEVEEKDYRAFLKKAFSVEELRANAYFRVCLAAFADSAEAKKLLKMKSFQRKNADEQADAYLEKFYMCAHQAEREKLLYFSLVYQQTTVIITSPEKKADRERFLGYKWSNRKGNEGIRDIKRGGKIFNDIDRTAEDTFAAAVRKSFDGEIPSFTEEQKAYGTVVCTKDLIDFSRADFGKALWLSNSSPVSFRSRYEMKPISIVFPIIESGSRPQGGVGQYSEGILSLGGEHLDNESGYLRLDSPKYIPQEYYDACEKGKVQKDDILICKDGARTGKVAIVRDELNDTPAMLNEHVFLLRSLDEQLQHYAFYILHSGIGHAVLRAAVSGGAQGGLNRTNLEQICIPMPPEDIRNEVVAKCALIDEEYRSTRMSVDTYRQKIKAVFIESGVINAQDTE